MSQVFKLWGSLENYLQRLHLENKSSPCAKSQFLYPSKCSSFSLLADKAADGGTVEQGLDKVHLLLGLFVRGRVLTNQTEDVGAGVFFIFLLQPH